MRGQRCCAYPARLCTTVLRTIFDGSELLFGVAPDVDIREAEFAVRLPRPRTTGDHRRHDEERDDDTGYDDPGDGTDSGARGPLGCLRERGDPDRPRDEQD